MLSHRIIPSLLLRNGGLVKTVKFEDPKYVGDPINAIKIFNDKEVDELMVLDIVTSKERKSPNYSIIEQFASECFMPVCYGGGVTTVQQAKDIFSLGVEKICLQTAVLDEMSLITKLSEQFGAQSILVSVDIKRNWRGKPQLYSSARKKTVDIPWKDFVKRAVAAGAGEIVLNAVDRDGLMNGMDLPLIAEASEGLSVPLIVVGGVGSLTHMKEAIDAGANAVSAGSYFVFHGPHRAVLITYPDYNQLQQLFQK